MNYFNGIVSHLKWLSLGLHAKKIDKYINMYAAEEEYLYELWDDDHKIVATLE